jgi:hypothetical protein
MAHGRPRRHGSTDIFSGYSEWLEDEELNYEFREWDERQPKRLETSFRNLLRRLGLLRPWYRITGFIRKIVRYFFGYRMLAPHQLAGLIGYVDFRRLILAKGLELGIIEECERQPEYEGGHVDIIYVLATAVTPKGDSSRVQGSP